MLIFPAPSINRAISAHRIIKLYSNPPSLIKNPCFRWTLIIATTMKITRGITAMRVQKPIMRNAPPTRHVYAATYAQRVAEANPIPASIFENPATPGPLYNPKHICSPCAANITLTQALILNSQYPYYGPPFNNLFIIQYLFLQPQERYRHIIK